MYEMNSFEKIVINSPEDMNRYERVELKCKHIIVNCDVKGIKLGCLESCMIEGKRVVCHKMHKCRVFGVEYVYADYLDVVNFYNCKKVVCGDFDGCTARLAQFYKCDGVIVRSVKLNECRFIECGKLDFTDSVAEDCVIVNCECDDCSLVSLEDSSMGNCTFKNIKLLDSAYLVDGVGTPWIENCIFENIHTSRTDGELFIQEEEKGIFKKKVRYCFVDEDSCIGLDD